MTHAGAHSQLLLNVPLYHKKHKPYFAYATQLVVVSQGNIRRFTNNNTVPLAYRETDKDHVEKLNYRAQNFGLVGVFPNLPLMLGWHDSPEVYGEAKTVNGILFKGLLHDDLTDFERLAFETVAIDAAISVVKNNPQEGEYAKVKFLERIHKDKTRMDKHSVFYTGSEQPDFATPLAEMLDINKAAKQRLESTLTNGNQQTAKKIVADATAYYSAYSCPHRRQTDPMVATAKLLDNWEGIQQITAVAQNIHYNMADSKTFALLDINKNKKYNKNGGMPISFLNSDTVLIDAQNFAKKISIFRTVMSQNLPHQSAITNHVCEQALKSGADFLTNIKPFYSFEIEEPTLHAGAVKHIKHHQKIISGKYPSQVFDAQTMAQAFINGVDVTNHKQILGFYMNQKSLKISGL